MPDKLVENKKKRQADRVVGFSERFNIFLDQLEMPKKSRYTEGSQITGSSISTFRNWCTKDMAPRKYEDLNKVVKALCSKKNIRMNHQYVSAWLFTGLPSINPFDSNNKEEILKTTIALDFLTSELLTLNQNFQTLNESCKTALLTAVSEDIKKAPCPLNDYQCFIKYLQQRQGLKELVSTLVHHLSKN